MEEELNINQESETVENITVSPEIDNSDDVTLSQQMETPVKPLVLDGQDMGTPSIDDYNKVSIDEELKSEKNISFGSCDCRSECKYHTGHTHKYADYGYSD